MDPENEPFADRMLAAIREADVMSFFFVRVGHSLILDFRSDTGVPPEILLDGMVGSPRERLLSFRRLRPSLPLPEEITLVPWLDPVADFRRQGMLEAVVNRCKMTASIDLANEVIVRYRELLELETESYRALIRGDGMKTIWQRETHA